MQHDAKLPLDLKQRALETFGLELLAGAGQDDAIVSAVMSALDALHRQVTDEIADLAMKFAQDIETEDGEEPDGSIAFDGSAALLWFARQLKERIPPEGDYDYEPRIGDTVEVIMLGTVIDVTDEAGPDDTWGFANDYMEADLAYGDPIRVRLMHRGEDDDEHEPS